jgi:small subunit ribosomal protein S20
LPNIKAAEKWARQTDTRTTRNKDAKSRLRTLFKKAVAENSSELANATESAFDKAAAKGIIHPNKAARKKSRLVKAMRKAATTAAKPAKSKATKSTRTKSKSAK